MTAPSITRCAGAALLSGCSLVFLVGLPAPPWPSGDPATLADWWASVGPIGAAAAAVRVCGISIAAWLLVAGVAGVISGATGRWVERWHRLTPFRIGRILLAGTLSAAAFSGPPASAVDSSPSVLRDLGPVDEDSSPAATPMVLRDRGPVESPPADRVASTRSHPALETWVVAPGDHLWAVAEATVASFGLEPDENITASYWTRLIDANRATVGNDPDLIHPGDVLVLPPAPAAGSQGW